MTIRWVRGLAAAVVAAGAALTLGAAALAPAAPCQSYAAGTFNTENECRDRAWYYKQDQPLLGYTCASNGNPANGTSTWTLYEKNCLTAEQR